jgi:tetratricopeptide (TPR) repeat protein
VGDRLRPLWDFDDLDATQRRLETQLEQEVTDAQRAEVLTQLARVEGLRGRFDECERLLGDAETLAGPTKVVRARVDLERGRKLRSSGDSVSALPLFEAAVATALDAGEEFVAVDAAHMAAIAAPDRERAVEWTERGIELTEASSDEDARYWLGPLLNNLGWTHFEADDHAAALEAFERALAARERRPQEPYPIQIARYAVGRALRALGRAREAVPLLERAAAWADANGRPDSYFHEELAEAYAAVGRSAPARDHAQRALALVDGAAEPERASRLRELAAAE